MLCIESVYAKIEIICLTTVGFSLIFAIKKRKNLEYKLFKIVEL